LAIDASGNYLYAANVASNSISAFRINQTTGALSALPGSPFATGRFPMSVATDDTGTFLFAANEGSANMSTYRINPDTGALTRLAPGTLRTGIQPRSTAVAVIP
jgi:6-phosphogluconolactonase (cycloisomerase 2 family)